MKNKTITIYAEVKNKSDLFNTFSQEVLSHELREYILDEVTGQPFNKKIVLNLKTYFEMTDEDKEIFKKAVKTEYKDVIKETNLIIEHNNVKELLMFCVGFFLIVLYYLLNNFEHIITEIILIFSWVAIWEAAYSVMFLSTERRINLKRLKQLYNMSVEYECLSNKKG